MRHDFKLKSRFVLMKEVSVFGEMGCPGTRVGGEKGYLYFTF